MALLSALAACGDEPGTNQVFGSNAAHLPTLQEGLAIQVWAESPQLFNPTNLDVDARGRVWVVEAVNYRTPERRGARHHAQGDRVVILEDTDGDGTCDSSKVFVQDEDLVAPMGIVVLGNRVLVSCSPAAWMFIDDDGDDRADRKEIFLGGFGGVDNDHGLHAFAAAPDGSLVFNVGDAGPHVVTDRDGWTLRSAGLDRPGMQSDDGRVWTGGMALRIQPDGTGLEVLAHNFRNCYEVAVDSYGDLWQSDNDDGRNSCRTSWLMQGANMGFFSADGSRTWKADKRPGQSVVRAHWRQDDPGVLPAGDITGAGAPTGVLVYEGDELGERMHGTLLCADAGRNRILVYRPRPSGAGFALESELFLSSVPESGSKHAEDAAGDAAESKGQWFRPSDIAAGTDGALYVADWYDPIAGNHRAGDFEAAGRIYRITREGSNPRPPEIDLSTPEGRLRALQSPAPSVRHLGHVALQEAGEDGSPALLELLESRRPVDRARAVWRLAEAGPASRSKVEAMLADPDPRLRIAAFRALGRPLERAQELAADPSPAVRREVAVSLRDVPLDACRDVLLRLAAGFDGVDRTYLEAFGLACDGKEQAVYPLLAAGLGAEPLEWSEAFAALTWRLHPPQAIPALRTRALSSALSIDARLRALDTLAFSEQPEALEVLLELAKSEHDELRKLADWWVWQRRSRSAAKGERSLLPPEVDAAWRSGTLVDGELEVELELDGAARLWLALESREEGRQDLAAAWGEPVLVGPGRELRLVDLPLEAIEERGAVRFNLDCEGGPLVIEGRPVPFGIGTRAPSVVRFELPPGEYTHFRTRAGVTRPKHATEAAVEFLVFLERPTQSEEALLQATKLASDETTLEEQRSIVEALAEDAAGGRLLVDLAARGQLTPELLEAAAPRIFRNPDLSVRAVASSYFPRLTSQGKAFPAVDELLALEGDVERGREVFFGPRASCSSCHNLEGRGGEVGPDLSTIGQQYTREALLDAILNPSAAIPQGYETWFVETVDGSLYCGFIRGDGETLILEDSSGAQHSIPKDEVAFRRRETTSIMPDNVALGLEPEELMDIVAFLRR